MCRVIISSLWPIRSPAFARGTVGRFVNHRCSSGEHGLDTNAMPDAFVPAVVGYVITSPTEGFGDIRANVCSLNVLDFHQSIEYATDMPCFASPPCV